MESVTVAIPFSQESINHFLLAIRSVYAQTLEDWRLILVGDNARSELVGAAQRIAEADSRVQCVSDGRGLGLAARLNQVSSLAETPYLARMDADDVMHPDRLARQMEFLRVTPGVDLVACRAVVIDEENSVNGLLREDAEIPTTVSAATRSNLMTHPSITGRTEWFQRNPYLTTIARAEDQELWLRTFSYSTFHKLGEPLLYYRVPRGFNRRKAVSTVLDSYRAVELHGDVAGMRRWSLLATAYAKSIVYATMPTACWPKVRGGRIVKQPDAVQDQWSQKLAVLMKTQLPGLER